MAEYNLNCSLPFEYPQIVETELNRYDKQMLYNLLANKLCSVNEYITQSVILAPEYPHLADIIDCIAVSESKHFKLLGKLLLLSGARWDVHTLAGSCRRLRRTSFTGEPDPGVILNESVERERTLVSDTKLVLSQVYNSVMSELLKRILLDDEHHIGILSEISLRYI